MKRIIRMAGRVSTHSRLEAADAVARLSFSAERLVSTHSRLEAADQEIARRVFADDVSTHSRLEAAERHRRGGF